MDRKMGRLLLTLGFLLLIFLFAWETFADEIRIVEARRNIPLADTDPIYKDFYLNAGSESGLKPNQVVTAVRKFGVKDSTGTQSFGDIKTPVGQLRIIYVTNHLAVAREFQLKSRENDPMLEQIGIMIGDEIDQKGSFTVKPEHPPAAPAEISQQAPPPPPSEAVTAQQTAVESVAQAMEKVANQSE